MMSRLSQKILSNCRTLLKKQGILNKNPQKKAIILAVTTVSPKKPNSANRRIARVNITSLDKSTSVKIPGEGLSNLQQHSTVLLRGVKVKDLIGIKLAAIRGKFDLLGVNNRKTSRSLYGVPKR
jgi:small subunit ribosomal protein S12